MGTSGKGGRGAEAPAFDPRAAWRGTLGAAPLLASAAVFLLGAAVLLAFRGALADGLVDWDDDVYLERIPQLHDWTRTNWTSNLLWILTDRARFYWHPLAYGFHAAENGLFGGDLRLHHLAGLVLHALNAVWVLVLACAFLGPRRGEAPPARPAGVLGAALLAALLWALHPLRVESAAWLAEQKDLLCGFFSLAATAAWLLRATAPAGAPGGRWTLAVFACFVLALAAKPVAVALPAAWFVLDLAVLGRAGRPGGLRAAAMEKVPFLVLGFAAVVAGATGEKEEGRVSSSLVLGFEHRVVTPLWGFAAPLVKTAVPVGLSPFDPQFPAGEIRLLSPRWLGSLALLVAASVFALRRWRRGEPWWAAAWLAYLALAAPVSGIRQLATLATADRFSYLPTVPLFVLAGAGILAAGRAAAARFGPAGVAAAAGVPLLAAWGLALLAGRQVEVWRDPDTLWARVLREWPDRKPEPQDHLGAWHAKEAARTGDMDLWRKARGEFLESIRYFGANPAAWNNLGRVEEVLGDGAKAERCLRESARLADRFPLPRWNLARVLARKGERKEAERWYREALAAGGEVDPRLVAEVEGLLGIPAK
jgi:hypothetical protein